MHIEIFVPYEEKSKKVALHVITLLILNWEGGRIFL